VQAPKLFHLSERAFLVYILRSSACHGRLAQGWIERLGERRIAVYDSLGNLFEYISDSALRSWCVVDVEGVPVPGWRSVEPEDAARLLTNRTT
jgi:hypothetical protein